MAKECYFTGRKARSGNTRSKAMNKTKRRFGANLQKVRILVDGEPKKVWVSARALKSGKVDAFNSDDPSPLDWGFFLSKTSSV